MTSILIILIALVLIGNGVLVVLFLRNRNQANQPAPAADTTGLNLILTQMNELNRTMEQKMTDTDRKMTENSRHMSDTVHRQFSESAKLIKEITSELAQVKETGKQVISFADQLQSLQDILKNPKQRGVLGEYYLETLLKNILPPGNYQMQYKLGKTDAGADLIVDAAVFVKDKVIPIDSKFSLENYNRLIEERDPTERDHLEKLFVNDLKLRIQETAKYVRPQDGTMEFAFMFIPHEAIYYDLLVNKIGTTATAAGDENENLIQRAASKYKVIIVSPTSFLAYLQTVLQGLKALQIEETAKDIIKRVEELGTHLKKYEEYHGKLGTTLSTVVNHFNSSAKELKKVDKDVLRITGQTPGIEVVLVEKPDMES
jgi:DNA recombination protein RmuC